MLGCLGGKVGNAVDSVLIIGWIVHGHFRTLHVSYKESDRPVVSVLPTLVICTIADAALDRES